MLMGFVTVPSTAPFMASSIAFSTYRKAASPASADNTPGRTVSAPAVSISSTSMQPGRYRPSAGALTRRKLTPSSRTVKAARLKISVFPMTSGLHTWYNCGPQSAFTVISGPTPAGSPIVIASRGRSMLFFLRLAEFVFGLSAFLSSYLFFSVFARCFLPGTVEPACPYAAVKNNTPASRFASAQRPGRCN